MDEHRHELDKIWDQLNEHGKYIASHEGQITAYWKAQWEWNMKLEKRVDTHEGKITLLEKKVLLMSACGSAAGAGLMWFAKFLLGG